MPGTHLSSPSTDERFVRRTERGRRRLRTWLAWSAGWGGTSSSSRRRRVTPLPTPKRRPDLHARRRHFPPSPSPGGSVCASSLQLISNDRCLVRRALAKEYPKPLLVLGRNRI